MSGTPDLVLEDASAVIDAQPPAVPIPTASSIKDVVSAMIQEMKALPVSDGSNQTTNTTFDFNNPPESVHPVDRLLTATHGLYLYGNQLLQSYISGNADIKYLNEAIQALGGAFNMSSPKHPQLPTYMLALGKALIRMYRAYKDGNNREERLINDAIMFLTRCLDMTEEVASRTDRADMFKELGEAYGHRFEQSKNPEDLTTAIKYIQRAIPIAHPDYGYDYLCGPFNSLGTLSLLQYNELGDMDRLHQALSAFNIAVALAPDNYRQLPMILLGEANALEERFIRLNHSGDLDQAILSARRAYEVASERPNPGPMFREYLLGLLAHRWQHDTHGNDVEEIVQVCREGLDQTDPSHKDYLRNVLWLGSSFVSLYNKDKDIHHIDEAIDLLQVALRGMEKDDPAYTLVLSNSANARLTRYDHLHDIADLNTAIQLLQTIIDILPPTRPELSEWREKLGDTFVFRYNAKNDEEDAREAVSQYRQAALLTIGTQRHRAVAARKWTLMEGRLGNTEEALVAYQLAVELAVLLTGLERSMDQRQTYLVEAHDAGLYHSARALREGGVERALVWLELGRGLLWRQLSDVRTPTDELEAQYPELARQLRDLSRQLEGSDMLSVSPSSKAKVGGDMHWTLSMPAPLRRIIWRDNESLSRYKLVLDWEGTLREIREKQGFDTFLRPQPIEDILKHLPRRGPTVVIHSHREGTGAIIIDHDPCEESKIRLRSLLLPKFTFEKGEMMVEKLREKLRETGLRGGGGAEDRTDDEADSSRSLKRFRPRKDQRDNTGAVLNELWECVAKPVVEHLGLKPSAQPSAKTRIWWCITGPLAFLPIHAAGNYSGSSEELGNSIADYAISSYTPTLASLAKRVRDESSRSSMNLESAAPAGKHLRGLLIVSHSEAPNLPKLPGAVAEVAAIRKVLEEASQVDPVVHLNNERATVSTTRDMIASQQFSMVHFACHANQEDHNPLESGFSLHDGKLSLADIIRRQPESSLTSTPLRSLAFLSACQTSTETEKFSEEAVHLVAGMLSAGYRGVVGTMWGIPDAYAPLIAEEFYRRLLGPGEQTSDAPYALHCATETLRKKLGNSENARLAWIPFVHFGL